MDRRHPHRLTKDAYAELNRVVFVTSCTKGRSCHFDQPEPATLALRLAEEMLEGLIAVTVMPDHVHLVILTVPSERVDVLVARWKGRAAYELHRMGMDGTIWGRSYWDRHARGDDDLAKMIDYVLDNPVRKGLCQQREEWPYSLFRGYPEAW